MSLWIGENTAQNPKPICFKRRGAIGAIRGKYRWNPLPSF